MSTKDLYTYGDERLARAVAEYVAAEKSANLFHTLSGHLLHTAALTKGMRAIDLGCGIGESTRALLHAVGKEGSVVGIDSSKPMIEQARRNVSEPNVEFRLLAVETIDAWFEAESVDAVLCSQAMWHLDFEKTLGALKKLLKPHGILAFNTRWDVMPEDLPLAPKTAHFLLEFTKRAVSLARSKRYDPGHQPRPSRKTMSFLEMYKIFPLAGFTLMQCQVFEVALTPPRFLAWLRCPRAAARFLPGLDPVKQSAIFRKAMAGLKPKSIRLKYADLVLYRD